ncbi:MAG: L-arabinose ABC transporter permease AraH [Syntrophaceae bacterium]|nr:L-arabinose ABC transporter permease AraH [Syntrophaceae bacterium]
MNRIVEQQAESAKAVWDLKKVRINRFLQNIWANSGMVVVYVVMFIACSVFVPYFFTLRNMIGLALSITTIGMIACTMMFILAAGDLDLSVGSIVAFSGIIAATVINQTGDVYIGALAGVIGGGAVGLLNGTLIAVFNLNPLICTLATMQIVRGGAMIVSDGIAIGITIPEFFALGNESVFGIPNPIWITILIFIVFGILLNSTSYGKNILAIGGNKEASRLAGINVSRMKNAAFTLQGVVCGIAGVILSSRMTSGQPNVGLGLELDVIAACVLGGVSLLGGIATIEGLLAGVLIMGTVQNVLNLLNVETFYQYVVRGAILIIAILLDQFKQRNQSAVMR